MPVLERILTMGITGSGKSYQWLMLARALKPTGAIFRCLDTDNSIPFMLATQFEDLMPENGGNVYVVPSFDWPDYKLGVDWLQRKQLSPEQQARLPAEAIKDLKRPLKTIDWTVVDMADMAWSTVQRYFVSEIFDVDAGDYFLKIRRELQDGERKAKKGGSPTAEGLDGWRDWGVINKLYDDWVLPIIYRIQTHVYCTTAVTKVDRGEKDAEVQMMYGDLGFRPSGQKRLGHQMHSIFLMIPGKDRWYITTVKDRAGRTYFDRMKLSSFYMQYLVAKAKFPIV